MVSAEVYEEMVDKTEKVLFKYAEIVTLLVVIPHHTVGFLGQNCWSKFTSNPT